MLDRLWSEPGLIDLIVPAFEGERLVCSQPVDDLQSFVGTPTALGLGDGKTLKLFDLIPHPYPELEAPLRDDIDRSPVLCHANGIVKRQEHDGGADPHGGGSCGDGRSNWEQ